MSFGQMAILLGLFSSVWVGSMFIIDARQEVRTHEAMDSLEVVVKQEVSRYRNVYTVEEIITMSSEKYTKDIQDLKTLVKSTADDNRREFKKYVEKEKTKYDTIYVEIGESKYMYLGQTVLGEFYVAKRVEINKFPFE
jgi:predicted RND superfamily exporter protein